MQLIIKKIMRRLQVIAPRRIKPKILKWGYSIGENLILRNHCYSMGNYIEIGNNVFINNFCKFYS